MPCIRVVLSRCACLLRVRCRFFRGPPAVVETDARTWLSLACGLLTWDEAVDASLVSASGERTDLGPFLPLV